MALRFDTKLSLLKAIPPLLQQDSEELSILIKTLTFLKSAAPLRRVPYTRDQRPYSILEVGSAAGGNLFLLTHALGATRTRGVDNTALAFESDMRQVIRDDPAVDHQELIIDSRDPAAARWAMKHGPYDLVYIDGNHEYEYATADLHNFGRLAPIVALHDAQHCPGVVQLREEVRVGAHSSWASQIVNIFAKPKSCGIFLCFCHSPLGGADSCHVTPAVPHTEFDGKLWTDVGDFEIRAGREEQT